MRLPLVSCFLLFACNSDAEDTGPAPTFSEIKEEILIPSCGFSSCHGDAGEGGLTLDDATESSALIDVASTGLDGAILVVPGDADSSYLIQKMEGASGIAGDAMPPSGALDTEITDRVRAWIDDGASG